MSHNADNTLIPGVVIMLILILLGVLLRRLGILKAEDGRLTSNLVLKVTLPALIFYSLADNDLNYRLFIISAIVGAVELICMILAYIIARIFNFSRSSTGAIILVSGFGMAAMLGYPLISEIFYDNQIAMMDAVIIGETGVGLVLFITAPIIAMYFGGNHVDGNTVMRSLKHFFTTPIFFAILAGIIVSSFDLSTENIAVSTLLRIFKLVGNANILLVAITMGLMLEFKNSLFKHLIFFSIAILIKLIAQPILTYLGTNMIGASGIDMEIAFILTAMPSALIICIYAKQYNCEPELVSASSLVTLLISLFSITALTELLFHH